MILEMSEQIVVPEATFQTCSKKCLLSLGKLRVASSFCASLSTPCLQFIIQCGPTRASGLYQMHWRKPREWNINLELLSRKRKTQLIVLLSTQIRVSRSEGYLGKYINVIILCSCYMTQHTNTIIIIVNTLLLLLLSRSSFHLAFSLHACPCPNFPLL